MNKVSETTASFLELKRLLDLIDINSEYFPESKETKIEHLLLPLNIKAESPLKIQLHYLNDLDKAHGIEQEAGLFLLQFFIEIPVKIPEDKAVSLIIIFLRLNGLIPFGNFGITDQGLYFRFIYPSRERVKNYGLIVEILDSISRYAAAIIPDLLDYAGGRKTLEESFKAAMENIQGIMEKKGG